MTMRMGSNVAIVSACMFITTTLAARAAELNRIPSDAKRVLENTSSMTLMSLDPTLRSPNVFARVTESLSYRHFHGWRLLGQINIDDAATRKKVVASVERAVHDFNGWIAACFKPRHALHVTSGTQTYDFVICYECSS